MFFSFFQFCPRESLATVSPAHPTTTWLFYTMLLQIWLWCVVAVHALDLFAPPRYKKGDSVELLLNKIESDHTQLPFHYHDLPFVCYDRSKKAKPMLLGEILRGDRLWESNYKLTFKEDKQCVRLCDMKTNEIGAARADYLIRNGYVAHWSVDGLPGATTFTSGNRVSKYYAAGFPLGFVKGETAFLYNHVTLVIRYHTAKDGMSSIVGFEVYPKSVINEVCPGASKSFKNFPLQLPRDKDNKLVPQNMIIPYTYSVYWREDNSVTYDNRWDLYYDNDSTATSTNIHWLSLVNLLVLVCLVSMVVAVAMFRLLKTDLQAGPALPVAQANLDQDSLSGLWKNLVNVVMVRPKWVLLLTTLMASGIQCLVAMIGVVVIFVLNSKLHFGPGSSSTFFNLHQGAFFSCLVLLLLASGFVSAYLGIVVDKLMNNEPPNSSYDLRRIRRLSCLFAGTLPFTVLCVVLFLNLFVWAKESSSALPFGTIVVLVVMFAIIELPLGILGGTLGNRFRFGARSVMVTSYVPDSKSSSKSAPRRSLVMNPVVSTLAFGLIPFGIVYVDLLFIFNSIWLEKTTFYYMYGFLLLTVVLLLVVVGESAIVATYLSLAMYNNPQWQWLCFRVGSSIGWYIYAYTVYYFVSYLLMADVVSILIYFSYMALVAVAIGVSCGAFAVVTSMVFVRNIYGLVKAD